MNSSLAIPLFVCVAGAPAAAQSEVLSSIPPPADQPSSWGTSFAALHDLDGDGVPELAVAGRVHAGAGGGIIGSVHSGADGRHLFSLPSPDGILFGGRGIASLEGPGGPELVILGSNSGAHNSPNGLISFHSPADGSLLRSYAPPAELTLVEAPVLVLGDLDGDGYEDFLTAVRRDLNGDGWAEHATLQAFSGADGAPLWPDPMEGTGIFPGTRYVRVDDHDGDGLDDFALFVRHPSEQLNWEMRLEIRSSADGRTLAILQPEGVGSVTGNGEPLVVLDDRDGDGLADLALGTVFGGLVVVFSSATGATLAKWSCAESPSTPCVGQRLVSPGDIDLDGVPDLVALQSLLVGQAFTSPPLFGLDPVGGEILFEESVPDLAGVYSADDRMVAFPGADPLGFAAFALFEEHGPRVTVRRAAPAVGTPTCDSTPNLTGAPATIRALGSAAVHRDHFAVVLEQAYPGRPALFLHGPEGIQVPFGNGFRCVGGSPLVRMPVATVEADGSMSERIDLGTRGLVPGATRFFQAYFREPSDVGFQTSNAVQVEFLP